jgi:hypothetical protein
MGAVLIYHRMIVSDTVIQRQDAGSAHVDTCQTSFVYRVFLNNMRHAGP